MTRNKKEQRLPAMRYIKNNKRRVSVLIVSLCLCFTIIYVANVLVMSTQATGEKIFIDNFRKMQFASLSTDTLGIELPDSSDEEAYKTALENYYKACEEFAADLEKQDGIKKAFASSTSYVMINPPIAALSFTFPLVDKENVQAVIDHFDAKLKEGRLPEKYGEVVLDSATMLNNHYTVGSSILNNDGEERPDFVIVGSLDCDTYIGVGIKNKNKGSVITVLTDGSVNEIKPLIKAAGYDFNDENDIADDFKTENEWYEKFVTKEFDQATKYIYVGIFVLLFISIFVVYTTYLRDRHNEWCLYCSIGYSRKSIYISIMGELLFTFAAATVFGIVLTAGLVVGLDYILIKPIGIYCRYFYPDTLLEIICAFVLLLGLLQIPVRYALYRIRTIDAMEDDIY